MVSRANPGDSKAAEKKKAVRENKPPYFPKGVCRYVRETGAQRTVAQESAMRRVYRAEFRQRLGYGETWFRQKDQARADSAGAQR